VHIPPRPGTQYGGQPGFVEVDIHTDRPSFFTGILGIATQNVDALAVAANGITAAAPYSLLALNQDCAKSPSGQVGGNGTVNVDADVNGEVRVNADCDDALLINGK